MVVDRDSETYDVYVDGELVLEGKPGWANNKTGDLLRMGVDNNSRGDLDIQSVRVGSGDASGALSAYDGPAYEQIKLLGVELSSYRQMEGAAATVTAAVTGRNCPDGTEVTLTLLDRDHAPVEGVTAYGALTGNAAELTLEIPDTLGPGAYYVQAEADAVRARVIAGMEGCPVEVLLEKPVNNTLFTGYTREYVPVLLKAPGHRQGGIVHAVLGAFDGTRCAAALAE